MVHLRVLGKDSEGYFNVEKNLWKPFGEYRLTNEVYIEFNINEIIRKIHIPSFNKFELENTLDFKDDIELIKEFKSLLSENSDIFNKNILENLLDFLLKTYKNKIY